MIVRVVGSDYLANHETVVSTHSLETLCIHFVVHFRLCPEQTCIPLLVHQQVREIHLHAREDTIMG